MTFLCLLRYVIKIIYTSSGWILLRLKQTILCSSVLIIRILLLVVAALDNTTNLGTINVISSRMPQGKKHWYNNVKLSSLKRLSIQEDVKVTWFTKLDEAYANPNRVGARCHSITFNLGVIFNVLSKNYLSTKEIHGFVYLGYYGSLPNITFGPWPFNFWTVMWHYALAFLLCDDMKEAYELMNLSPDDYDIFDNTLFLAGRTIKIPNRDLKVLAALIVSLEVYANSHQITFADTHKIPLTEDVEGFLYPIFQDYKGSELAADKVVAQDLAYWSLKIYGKLDQIISPFRIKVYQMFGVETKENKELAMALHCKFHGISPKDFCVDSMQGVLPLHIISKLMADGFIHKAENLCDVDGLVSSLAMKRNDEAEKIVGPSWLREPGAVYIRRGECLIINQVFSNDPTYERKGSFKDVKDLIKTWSDLGCKDNVTVISDVTETEMMTALKHFRRRLASKLPDFMVLVILSHGKRDIKTGREYIMDINWKGVALGSIKNMFIDGTKCKSMVGKPKLFFIQACRGTRHQNQRLISDLCSCHEDSFETDGEDDENKSIEINGIRYPHKSWFLIFHSTIKGFVSNRDPVQGSIFIQELCKEFRKKWFLFDVSRIAASVNKKVMEGYEQIQAPVFENQLGPTFFNVGNLNR